MDGATTSITRSGGEALQVEVAALALLAWLPEARHAGAVEKGLRFLADRCEAGRFGSTQGTILALKAIVACDQARSAPPAAGRVQVLIDGVAQDKPLVFDVSTRGTLTLPIAVQALPPGDHRIEVAMEGGGRMPCAISVQCHAERPDRGEAVPLALEARLTRNRVAEGEGLELRAVIQVTGTEAVASPVAILGIPGGCDLRHERLKELVQAGRIAAYEVRGRDLVLYWRQLVAGSRTDLAIDLIAAVPGSYTGPAGRAYPYYNDRLATWIDPLAIEITPAEK